MKTQKSLLLFILFHLTLSKQKCKMQNLSSKLPISLSYTHSVDKTSITLQELPSDCNHWSITQNGLPCQEVYFNNKNKKPENQYDELYFLTPINLDFDEEQKIASEILDRLNLYSEIDDVDNDENEILEIGQEEKILKFVNPEKFDFCLEFQADNDGILKDTFQKRANDESYRVFHQYYALVKLDDFFSKNEFTFDSVILPLASAKEEGDFENFDKFKKIMFIINFIFETLTHLTGLAIDPVSGWCDFKNEDNSEFDLKESIIEKIKEDIAKIGGQEDDENDETDENDDTDDKKRKLKECDNYFLSHPIFIPDLSVSDFVFTFPKEMFIEDDEEKISKKLDPNYFKNKSIEELLPFITLSNKTAPDFLLTTKIFELKYKDNPMFKKFLENNQKINDHRFFFFLKRFHDLFQEFINRYIIDDLIFSKCFDEAKVGKSDKECPVFFREILNLFEEKESGDFKKFYDLDINYMDSDPREIIEEINVFLKKALYYSEVYQNKNQKNLSPIKMEAVSNDLLTNFEHFDNIIETVPVIRGIKGEDKKSKSKEDGGSIDDNEEVDSNNSEDKNKKKTTTKTKASKEENLEKDPTKSKDKSVEPTDNKVSKSEEELLLI